MTYQQLIAELRFHVEALATEAANGDEAARRWCDEAFPGHVDFFLAAWSEGSPLQSQAQRQQQNNELGDEPQ